MLNHDNLRGMSHGNPLFSEWLVRVDELCMRFLDIDLWSIPEAQFEPHETDDAYEGNMDPETYFLTLLAAMRAGRDSDEIDRQFARMVKWGVSRP